MVCEMPSTHDNENDVVRRWIFDEVPAEEAMSGVH
jgi:hypothetical protein